MSRHALVIAIDGLRASALGAYGNTWHPTPALDSLAARSLLFDWMYGHGPTLESFYQAAWRGNPNYSKGGEASQPTAALADILGNAGIQTAVTTDDRWIAEHAESSGFAEVRHIEIGAERPAPTIDQTQFAQLCAFALDQIEPWATAADGSPRLLWLHARGFRGAWDAPLELRQQLLDDDDLAAPTFVTPPASVAVADHDELLLHRAAYAAQTIALDECLGAIFAALTELKIDGHVLVILTGTRGYALGEHGFVGSQVDSLYSELLHLPCLIRVPGEDSPQTRREQLVQPVDLHSTLLNWFGIETPSKGLIARHEPSELEQVRDYCLAIGAEGERMLRTPAWMLRSKPDKLHATPPPDSAAIELYVKPDDRWEANEIADRCPDVAARLLAALDRAGAADAADSTDFSPPLDADLVVPGR